MASSKRTLCLCVLRKRFGCHALLTSCRHQSSSRPVRGQRRSGAWLRYWIVRLCCCTGMVCRRGASFGLVLNVIQFASRCVLTDGVAELVPLLERNCTDVQGLLRADLD